MLTTDVCSSAWPTINTAPFVDDDGFGPWKASDGGKLTV